MIDSSLVHTIAFRRKSGSWHETFEVLGRWCGVKGQVLTYLKTTVQQLMGLQPLVHGRYTLPNVVSFFPSFLPSTDVHWDKSGASPPQVLMKIDHMDKVHIIAYGVACVQQLHFQDSCEHTTDTLDLFRTTCTFLTPQARLVFSELVLHFYIANTLGLFRTTYTFS